MWPLLAARGTRSPCMEQGSGVTDRSGSEVPADRLRPDRNVCFVCTSQQFHSSNVDAEVTFVLVPSEGRAKHANC